MNPRNLVSVVILLNIAFVLQRGFEFVFWAARLCVVAYVLYPAVQRMYFRKYDDYLLARKPCYLP